MKTALLALTVALSVCSCASSTTGNPPETTHPKGHGEHHGEHHGHGEQHGHGDKHHPKLSPALKAFHEVLRPVWHSPPGQEREKRACEQGATFAEQSKAVSAEAPPPGMQADRWAAATQKLASTAATLKQGCDAAARVGIEAKLDEMHTAFHELMESLPPPPGH